MGESKAVAALQAVPLPEGFGLHEPIAGRWISMWGMRLGMCTIDMHERCIRAGGNTTHGPKIGTSEYTGRNWIVRLHCDAVAFLQGLESRRG